MQTLKPLYVICVKKGRWCLRGDSDILESSSSPSATSRLKRRWIVYSTKSELIFNEFYVEYSLMSMRFCNLMKINNPFTSININFYAPADFVKDRLT